MKTLTIQLTIQIMIFIFFLNNLVNLVVIKNICLETPYRDLIGIFPEVEIANQLFLLFIHQILNLEAYTG